MNSGSLAAGLIIAAIVIGLWILHRRRKRKAASSSDGTASGGGAHNPRHTTDQR